MQQLEHEPIKGYEKIYTGNIGVWEHPKWSNL